MCLSPRFAMASAAALSLAALAALSSRSLACCSSLATLDAPGAALPPRMSTFVSGLSTSGLSSYGPQYVHKARSSSAVLVGGSRSPRGASAHRL